MAIIDDWERLARTVRFNAFLVLGILAILVFISANYEGKGSLLAIIALAGALGGIINSYYRLLKFNRSMNEKYESRDMRAVRFQTYLSPLIGITFALVLYLAILSNLTTELFGAGTLRGLFPEFSKTPYTSLFDFLNSTKVRPVTNGDAALVLFWAFVAGFSERFVPNMINNLISEKGERRKNR